MFGDSQRMEDSESNSSALGSDDDSCDPSDSEGSQSGEEDDEEAGDEHEHSENGEAFQEELARTEVVSSARAAISQGLHGDGSEGPGPGDSAPVYGPPTPWGPTVPNFLAQEKVAREGFIATLARTLRGADRKQ